MYRKLFTSRVLERKVVLISGGCAGIGRALAVRLAQAGARLAILDLDPLALGSLVQQLADRHNAEALGLPCDVADVAAVERALALVVERFGGVDLLICNAGILQSGAFLDTDLAVFRRVMAVNFFGALHCIRATLPSLLERGGQIVALGSLAGFAALPGHCAYSASKHALHGLMDSLGQELEGSGVNVMLVCPGRTRSELWRNALVGAGGASGTLPALGRETSAQAVAEAIYRGIRQRRRLLVLPNLDWRARLLARLLPRLRERLPLRPATASPARQRGA